MMFNETFFPTPKSVIDQMLAPLMDSGSYGRSLPYHAILEPSAGKGDIVDHLVNRYNVHKRSVSVIEIEPELQHVLIGKGYRIIDRDFLCYSDRYAFDLIVMNPPFADGADHLLKAWDILRSGDIVCLLNAETLLNPYTSQRQLLASIIEQHGRYEVAGPVFKTAERPTDVEVAIVWLHKDEPRAGVSFDAQHMDHDAAVSETEFSASPIAPSNMVKALVAQYQQAADLLVRKDALDAEYRFYTQNVLRNSLSVPAPQTSLNEQIDGLKAAFWEYVFSKTKMGQVTTSNFRRDFDAFTAQTSQIAFSEQNIMTVLQKFWLEFDQIIMDCIVEVFDKATAYHKDNIIHGEGWKTNKAWMVAPKVIIPYGITYEAKWNSWQTYWSSARDFYGDFDKALCFLSSRSLESIHGTGAAIEQRVGELNMGRRDDYSAKFSSTFFDVRIFKKGTVHLIFRDKELHKRFNQVAAQGKKWVGPGD